MKVDLETLKFVSLMDELARRTLGGFVHVKRTAMMFHNSVKVWKDCIVYDGEDGMGVYYPLMWDCDASGKRYKRDYEGRTIGDCLGRGYDVTVVEDEDGEMYIMVVFLNDNIGSGETSSIVIRNGAWNFIGAAFFSK